MKFSIQLFFARILILIFFYLKKYNSTLSLSNESKIIIKLKSTGRQQIMSTDLEDIKIKNKYPDEVYIVNNNTYKNKTGATTVVNLEENENTVILLWKNYSGENTRHFFKNCVNITEINLTEFNCPWIDSLGMMFYRCISLTSVIFGEFGGPKLKWTNQMFDYCRSLIYVDLSSFYTSKLIDMELMFRGCSSLKALNISNLDTSEVTNMNELFYGCSSLVSLNISNFNTAKVINISCMFKNCYNLTSIDLSRFDTSNVTNMGELFRNCFSLISINLSNFNTSKVDKIHSLFNCCTLLTYINISHFDTSQLTGAGHLFYNCTSLTSVDLPVFQKVQSIDYMFAGCVSLTSLNLINIFIGEIIRVENMFEDCYNLKYINLQNFKENNNVNIRTFKDMFKNISENVVICINETENPIITGLIKEIQYSTIFCGDNWFEEECLKGEYNNIEEKDVLIKKCKCPLNSSLSNFCPSAPEGYYLDKNDSYYKSCYSSCETCDISGEENNHNCIECKYNFSK